jgi:hypothetical protein
VLIAFQSTPRSGAITTGWCAAALLHMCHVTFCAVFNERARWLKKFAREAIRE